jgi:hypothetical protein
MLNGDLFPSGTPFRDYSVSEMSRTTANPMIEAHYLKSWPAIVRLILGLWCGNRAVGVIVFADPPREIFVRYGGYTWELGFSHCDCSPAAPRGPCR